MDFPSRILDGRIYAFDIGLPHMVYGQFLGESDPWFVLQSFNNIGQRDSLILAHTEDVDEIVVELDRLVVVREIAQADMPEQVNPTKKLKEWTDSGSLVGLFFEDEDDLQLGVITDMAGDWLRWLSYTRQGVQDMNRMTPKDNLRAVFFGGELERRVERNASVLSIQRSLEGPR